MGGLWYCKLPYWGWSCLKPGGPVSSTMATTFSWVQMQLQKAEGGDTFLAVDLKSVPAHCDEQHVDHVYTCIQVQIFIQSNIVKTK